jgi:hypothetical protein
MKQLYRVLVGIAVLQAGALACAMRRPHQDVGMPGHDALREQVLRAYLATHPPTTHYCLMVEGRAPGSVLASGLRDVSSQLLSVPDPDARGGTVCPVVLEIVPLRPISSLQTEVEIVRRAKLSMGADWHFSGDIYRASVVNGAWSVDPVVTNWVE